MRLSDRDSSRIAGSIRVFLDVGDSAHASSRTFHAAARVRFGRVASSTRSENAMNPVLI